LSAAVVSLYFFKVHEDLVDDTDFGEVQEILGEYIITQKGIMAKDRFYIPKNLVERFDNNAF
jgi:hypothetical protein